MCKIFRNAPSHVRSLLLPRMETAPGGRIYDYCHDVENHTLIDRTAYHSILNWVDSNCRRCPVCTAG